MGGKSKRQDRTGPTMTLPVHEKAARKAGVSLYGRTFRVLKKKREKRNPKNDRQFTCTHKVTQQKEQKPELQPTE